MEMDAIINDWKQNAERLGLKSGCRN
jgi:hypothetical protein